MLLFTSHYEANMAPKRLKQWIWENPKWPAFTWDAALLSTPLAAARRAQGEVAGMAKLLAARIAWSNADNAVQIHGGNGFAMEFPISRILCDARILSIFEGAAEIQAQVIARRLLDGSN